MLYAGAAPAVLHEGTTVPNHKKITKEERKENGERIKKKARGRKV